MIDISTIVVIVLVVGCLGTIAFVILFNFIAPPSDRSSDYTPISSTMSDGSGEDWDTIQNAPPISSYSDFDNETGLISAPQSLAETEGTDSASFSNTKSRGNGKGKAVAEGSDANPFRDPPSGDQYVNVSHAETLSIIPEDNVTAWLETYEPPTPIQLRRERSQRGCFRRSSTWPSLQGLIQVISKKSKEKQGYQPLLSAGDQQLEFPSNKLLKSQMVDVAATYLSSPIFTSHDTDYQQPLRGLDSAVHRVDIRKNKEPVIIYEVPKQTRKKVSKFLAEQYDIKTSLVPYYLILADGTIDENLEDETSTSSSGNSPVYPVFSGAFLTVLSYTYDGINSMNYGVLKLKRQKPMFDGISVLIPKNHSPWLMIQCLVERHLIVEYGGLLPRIFITAMKKEAQLSAARHSNQPIPRIIPREDKQHVYNAWLFLLEKGLRAPLTPSREKDWLDEQIYSESLVCTEGKPVLTCQSIKTFVHECWEADVARELDDIEVKFAEGKCWSQYSCCEHFVPGVIIVHMRACQRAKWRDANWRELHVHEGYL